MREAITYSPDGLEKSRRDEERRMVHEGTEIWRARKEEDQRQKRREQSELRRMLANYWPWGKPGGGAPCASALRKRNVPLEPADHHTGSTSRSNLLPQVWRTRSMMSRLSNDREHNKPDYNGYDAYNRYVGAENDEPHPIWNARKMHADFEKNDDRVYRLAAADVSSGGGGGGGDGDGIAAAGADDELMSIGKAAAAATSQSTRHVPMDATRPGYMIDSWRAIHSGNRDYIADLSEQMRRKQQRMMEEHHREQQSSLRHFDTWRRFWGRPGHGAPIDHARRRNNLHDILYRAQPATSLLLPSSSVY